MSADQPDSQFQIFDQEVIRLELPRSTFSRPSVEQFTPMGQISSMPWLLIAVSSYLLGSIPWGFLFARAKGIDIRQKGSGNIGAANALRVMGKKWGYLVFICDFLKGYLAVEISLLLATWFQVNLGLGSIIAGIMCVVGHDYPAWLGFKGGKGIATLAGVLLAVFSPLVCISFGAVWVVVFLIARYTSLASIVAVATLPLAAAAFVAKSEPDFPFLIGFCILMAALALWRHRSNIVRLLNRTENRFGKK